MNKFLFDLFPLIKEDPALMQTPMPIEAPEEADTVYALTALGPAEVILSRSSGLFRSRDGGKSWLDAYAGLFGDVPMPTTCLLPPI